MDFGFFDDEFRRVLMEIFINNITIHLKSVAYGQRRTFIHHLLHFGIAPKIKHYFNIPNRSIQRPERPDYRRSGIYRGQSGGAPGESGRAGDDYRQFDSRIRR